MDTLGLLFKSSAFLFCSIERTENQHAGLLWCLCMVTWIYHHVAQIGTQEVLRDVSSLLSPVPVNISLLCGRHIGV